MNKNRSNKILLPVTSVIGFVITQYASSANTRQTHYYFNISLKKQVLYKVDIGHIQKDDVMCLICITLFTFN